MPHLLAVGPKRAFTNDELRAFPFSVPAIRTLERLDLDVPFTLFVGENGSGKSTMLEAIAAAAEIPTLGAAEVGADDTLVAQRRLAAALRLGWRPRSRQGFFLRAEDFFGHLRSQARLDARILREKKESIGIPTLQNPATTGGTHIDEEHAARFIQQYDACSHGESFLDLFASRVKPRGLYLLDEPEAPLSPKRQLVLLTLLMRAAEKEAQFIIATHSPILLALPRARIWSFDTPPIQAIEYEDLEHVSVMRSFLANPEAYVQRLR